LYVEVKKKGYTMEFSEIEKELARRIDALSGRINRLELIFEHNRELNNKIVYALQTGDGRFAFTTEKEKL